MTRRGRMRSSWACIPCSLLLLSAFLSREVAAMYHQRHGIHRVYKVKVLTQTIQKGKRAEDQCTAGYTLCAANLGGDCCPNNYACAISSCYATTAAVSTCNGLVGYYGCPIEAGAGCCPQGFICGQDRCTPPAGSSYSATSCPTGYFLCPSSLGYGCCQNGMGCATDACYSTAPSTVVDIYTTTEDGTTATITTTTLSTPTAPTALSSDTAVAVPKLIPSTVPKLQASSSATPSSSSSGLTTAQLGGIIGGAIGLLLVVLLATFFIIRRLNQTARAVASQHESTSGTGTRRTTDKKSTTQANVAQVRVAPTPSEVDAMDCDPFLVRSGTATPARPGANGRSRTNSDVSGQQSSQGRYRTPDMDSEAGGYFDVPPRMHNYPGRYPMRSSLDSQGTAQHYQHGRHWSNTSELSAGSDDASAGIGSPLIPAPVELSIEGAFFPELPGSDTETESNGGRRHHVSLVSPLSTTTTGTGARPSPGGQQRRSDPQTRGRSDSGTPGPALDSVDETSEMMHGHYGSASVAVGQTQAGLSITQDISSPIQPGFAPPGKDEGKSDDQLHNDDPTR